MEFKVKATERSNSFFFLFAEVRVKMMWEEFH